jgi:hypothetical protein
MGDKSEIQLVAAPLAVFVALPTTNGTAEIEGGRVGEMGGGDRRGGSMSPMPPGPRMFTGSGAGLEEPGAGAGLEDGSDGRGPKL